MAVILAMAAISAWAVMTEHVSYVVTDGVSMNPLYHRGDLVFVLKSDSYHVGEIVAYHGSVRGQKVLHRIIGGNNGSGFVFKGDNNESIDPLRPSGDRLIGRAVLHVAKGGFWLKPLMGPTGLGMIGFLIVDGGAAAARTRREIPRGRRKKRVKAMARQGGSWAPAATIVNLVKQLPPGLRAAAGAVAALALIGLALGVAGWWRPVFETEKVSTGQGRTVTFSYSAKVPRSAAYDGTTATSPDPIFRKLANRVDFHVAYSGPPGILGVSARLTNGTGWHTTLQLVAEQAFATTSYQATAPLDLTALTSRADAASRAAGLGLGNSADLAIDAYVKSNGAMVFQAPLTLEINSVEMALGNGASLQAGNSTSGTASIVAAREVKVFGWSMMTAARARSAGFFLVLLAIAGAFAIFYFVRRNATVRTRTEIERRYPQLLVHVEPMASPPGKPVVNVDNFPALVKLAERYGQMILTWRRPDADDFVVRDEGITYRYRVPLEEPPALQNIEHVGRTPGVGSHRREESVGTVTEVSTSDPEKRNIVIKFEA